MDIALAVTKHGHTELDVLDLAGRSGDGHRVSDAVLVLGEDEEAGDHIPDQVLGAEPECGGDGGAHSEERSHVQAPDVDHHEDDEHDDHDEDHAPHHHPESGHAGSRSRGPLPYPLDESGAGGGQDQIEDDAGYDDDRGHQRRVRSGRVHPGRG